MQEKKAKWARWLCVLVLGIGLVLANLPGDGQKSESEAKAAEAIPMCDPVFGFGQRQQESKVEELVTGVAGAEAEARVQVFSESKSLNKTTERHLPAAGEESIRLLTGRQHKAERLDKSDPTFPGLGNQMDGKSGDYLNETTCEKWEVLTDKETLSVHASEVIKTKMIIWTSRELELAEQSRVRDLLTFSYDLDSSRGDAIRFEVRKK